MSDTVIQVENLGKKYIIGHQHKEKYTTFRDALTSNIKSILAKSTSIFKGKVLTEGDEEEEFWALQNINFEIKQGDRIGIIGRNGAGKSTLLKILSRITEPTKGSIKIKGRVASLLEVGTGFHPELSGRENIFLNGAILGMSRYEIRKRFDEIVEFAEIEKFLDTPVKRYSSGMYVRLAFAVAAHLEPEILIVDEVLAVGDAEFQKKCLGKLQDVSANDGRTVLFVSHNMGVISQLCKHAILLKNGELIEIDETKKVIDKYLSLKTTANSYEYLKNDSGKVNFFKSILALNNKGIPAENFQFDDNINLSVTIEINEWNPSAKFSCTLQSQTGEYLTTIVEDLSGIASSKSSTGNTFLIKFKEGVIAPNSYFFRLALFIPNGTVYDLVEMVCPVRIYDSGTKLSLFEGINYGSFFINYEIEK